MQALISHVVIDVYIICHLKPMYNLSLVLQATSDPVCTGGSGLLSQVTARGRGDGPGAGQ